MDFYAAYNNRGKILNELKKHNDAIVSLKRALILRPDEIIAYTNLGKVLQDISLNPLALRNYRRSLKISPTHTETQLYLAGSLRELGKYKEAIENYNSILQIDPHHPKAYDNLSVLLIQLGLDNYNRNPFIAKAEDSLGGDTGLVFQCIQLIKSFMEADLETTRKCRQKLSSNLTGKKFDRLNPQNKQFCLAYNSMIGALIDSREHTNYSIKPPFIFHIGESHCLSYAHQTLVLSGVVHTIQPRLIIGAKAWHFASEESNSYKSLFAECVKSLPEQSNIFLSFGEIDCRENEGILAFSKKSNRKIDEIVAETVSGYVEFIANQFKNKRCNVFFFDVPAPVGIKNSEATAEYNLLEKANLIKTFNALLMDNVESRNFHFIDTHSFTSNEEGISNRRYHLDYRHLGPWSLKKLREQLE